MFSRMFSQSFKITGRSGKVVVGVFVLFFMVFCIKEINFNRMEKEVRKEMVNMLKPRIVEPSKYALEFQEQTKGIDITSKEYSELAEASVQKEMVNMLKPRIVEPSKYALEFQEQTKGIDITSKEYSELAEASVQKEIFNALKPGGAQTQTLEISVVPQKKNSFIKTFFGFY